MEFEARISKSFDILASNLGEKLYAKLLASWDGYITLLLLLLLLLHLGLLQKCKTGFIVNCDIKHQQKQPSWGVPLKTFERSFIIFFIVKVDLKFLQKRRKTNVNDYIICSISRTKPILWNAFSCSNKLLPLRRTYPFYGDEN